MEIPLRIKLSIMLVRRGTRGEISDEKEYSGAARARSPVAAANPPKIMSLSRAET